MKKTICSILALSILSWTLPLHAKAEIAQMQKDHNCLYTAGCGAEDGAFTALNTSMLGWGFGISTAIAVLAASLHQSKAKTSHSVNCCRNGQ